MSATLDPGGWWEHVAAFQAEVPSPLHPSADQIMGEYFLEMRSAAYRDNAAEILRLAALICDRVVRELNRYGASLKSSRTADGRRGARQARKQAREFGQRWGRFRARAA